ncbi:MAG TPA: hypothetical protein VK453_17320 [Micromonosporaceae bacterium]|nr:hypothetical protein [Micromonosporaceae bacterium]
MTKPAFVDKSKVIAELRSRGLDGRADWFDRQMPDLIDADKNLGILQTLGIDLAAVAAVDPVPSPS